MPQLTSGRHFAVSADHLLPYLTTGSDEQKYVAILSYRLSVGSPQALRNQLLIAYFREGEGEPPNAPAYPSGYSVRDVLEGRSDWAPAEVDEFRVWLESNPRLDAWLLQEFETINRAIQTDPLWRSSLLMDD